MMTIPRFFRITAIAMTLSVTASCTPQKRLNPVLAGDGKEVVVMNFEQALAIDDLPEGWYHRKFWSSEPMDISFVEKDERTAIRLATNDSASMLFRYTDLSLDEYPFLAWDWLVEKPVTSDLDETTEAGDDHPARLYLKFAFEDGSTRAMELIWGNQKLQTGDWKYLGDPASKKRFPHYVVRGGNIHVGRWHDERVNLKALVAKEWGLTGPLRVVEIALFCDTDGTAASSVAYFSRVALEKSNESKR